MYSPETLPKYKKRVSKQRKNKKLTGLFLFFFLLIAIITFFNSSISRIIDIKISGNELLSVEDIYDKANLNINMQYLFARVSTIEKKILEVEEVKGVKVKKQFPGKLYIEIEEFKPVALLYKSNKDFIPILENGYLTTKINKMVVDFPLVTKWNDYNQLEKLAQELTKIKASTLEDISEIRQNPQEHDPLQLLIYSKEGYRIHIPLDKLSSKLNLYPNIIENLKEINPNLGDIYLLESNRFGEFNKSSNNEKE